MDPKNVPNQGTSINFDAQALHDAEEAEIQREEDERQNELKNLLTCAFDCDLSDEDSIDEDTSQNFSHHNHDSITAETTGGEQWQQRPNGHVSGPRPNSHTGVIPGPHQQFMITQHASTPISGQAPPFLASPAHAQSFTPFNQGPFQEPTPHGQFQDTPRQHYQEPVNTHYHQEQVHEQFHANNDFPDETSAHQFEGHKLLDLGQLRSGGPMIEGNATAGRYSVQHVDGDLPAEREEIEGENEDDGIPHSAPTPTRAHHPPTFSGSNFHQYRHPHTRPMQDQRPQTYGDSQDGNGEEDGADLYGASMPAENMHARGGQSQHSDPNSAFVSNQEGYKVQYVNSQPKRLVDTSGVSTVSAESDDVNDAMTSEAGSSMPLPTTPPSGETRRDHMQKEFLSPEGTPRGGQFTQLEILYRARGNKIEELITELKQVKDDSDREVRILKHKLTMLEGERDGLKGSLEQSKQLLTDTKHREQALQSKVQDFESQLQALVAQKNELHGKLEESESHIEALTAQLADLGTSEALTRTREQHESVVRGMQQKYDAQILALTQQLDASKQDAEHKEEELSAVKKEALLLMKEVESGKVDRAETVNQLTRSLEESQRQCRQLLDQGATQEASKLKIQLQETLAGKSIAEDMNSALQDEIRELKEQLTMYESASQLGALPGVFGDTMAPEGSTGHIDDSYAALGIKQSDDTQGTNVPDSARSDETALNAETMHGLKKELTRCLAMYKDKRQQLTATSAQLKNSNAQLDDLRQKLEKTEKELKETKDELNKYTELSSTGATSLKEAQLTKQCEQINNEKQLILLELQEIKSRFDEVAASEEKLTEMNTQLRAQMSSMVKEFDEDKRQAVEKAQEACLQHHEDSKVKLREQLEEEAKAKLQQTSDEFEAKLTQLKEELKVCQNELDDVKQTYLKVCEEKGLLEEGKAQLEAKVNSEWEQRLNVELHQLRLELNGQQEVALEQQHESIATEHEVALANAKDMWRQEQQAELEQAIERQVEVAHDEWLKAHEADKQEALEEAVKEAETRTEERVRREIRDQCNEDMEHTLQEAKLKWQTDKRVSFERELQERLQAARETWTTTDLPAAVEEAKQAWNASVLGDFPTEVNKLRVEKSNLEMEYSTSKEKWAEEKEKLVKEKDAELETALQQIKERAEKDYAVFLEEHKDTLNNALKAARDGHQKELDELKKTHVQEIELLRKELENEAASQKKISEEKEANERSWQEKLETLTKSHRQDKEQLLAEHRATLHATLEEARSKWQEDVEKLKVEKQEILSREQKLEEEKEKYKSELSRLESLLQSADAHMEAEISKLHGELDDAHSKQLTHQINAHVAKVETELTKKLDTVLGEKSALNGKLEETRSLLKELESKYKKDTSNLAEKARSYKHDLHAARKELEEKWRNQEGLDSQRGQLSNKCRELEKQLDKAERQKKDVVEAYRKSEAEYAQIVDSYKLRQTELSDKVHKLEHKLSMKESEANKEYTLLHESLDREHSATVENLKREIVELKSKHKRATDTMKRQYAAEKSRWKEEIEAFKKQQRSLMESSTQTDVSSTSTIDEATLQELRVRYTRAVSKMKLDVIRHVTKSNELAAEAVKIEVLKERHKTATRLRKYYMRCLAELLDEDRGREHKLQLMEAALNNMPSTVTSAATSRSNTPSVVDLHTPTPSDFTQPMQQALSSTLRSTHVTERPQTSRKTPQSSSKSDERAFRKITNGKHHKSSSRTQSDDRLAKLSTSTPTRSKSEDRRIETGSFILRPYYGKDESEVETPVATPAETPIEELLRQEEILKEKLARQSQKLNRSHKGKGESRDGSYRHRNSGDYADYDTHSKHSSGRESDFYKNRSMQAALESSDGRHSGNSSKRTSFGAVTEYPRSPNKHPSEPNLHAKYDSRGHLQSRGRLFESDTGLSTASQTSEPQGNQSVKSTPSSPPKKKAASKYKYTSLRTNLDPSFTPLAKAASSSNLTDTARNKTTSLYDFPESAFKSVIQDPAPQRDTDSDATTPTAFSTARKMSSDSDTTVGARRQRQVLSSSSGSSITRPTARRASSESRLPRPVATVLQTNNNNNCDLQQSAVSSFDVYDKYSPGDSGISTRQASFGNSGVAQLSEEARFPPAVTTDANDSTISPRVTELRLSWESNPPQSFNIHTRYSKT